VGTFIFEIKILISHFLSLEPNSFIIFVCIKVFYESKNMEKNLKMSKINLIIFEIKMQGSGNQYVKNLHKKLTLFIGYIKE